MVAFSKNQPPALSANVHARMHDKLHTHLFTYDQNTKHGIAGVSYGASDAPVRMVFLHANGFHGHAYRTLLEPFARAQNIHILALDLRGHGGTTLEAKIENYHNWQIHVHDIAHILRQHVFSQASPKIILAGHSMGANVAILLAQAFDNNIEKVLAFDPVIAPFMMHVIVRLPFGRQLMGRVFPIARQAGQRREHFESFEKAYQHYRSRGLFKKFTDEAVWDYVSVGFRQAQNGHVVMSCSALWEKRGFLAISSHMMKALKHLPAGSHIISTDFIKQGAWRQNIIRDKAQNHGKFSKINLDYRPDLDHFFPLLDTQATQKALFKSLQA